MTRAASMGGSWERVTLGCSGAVVLRSPDGAHHAKQVTGAGAMADLAGERDRQLWLAGTGVPAPVCVDWVEGDDAATLVSTTVPGIPASAVGPGDAEHAVRGIAALLAGLHAVDAPCPFDRSLSTTVPLARRSVVEGTIDLDDLDHERAGRTASSLLAELEARASTQVEQLVLCHGDASLPNLFLDPETWDPSGIVDVGRLGRADPALDLALVTRSMTDDRNPGFGRRHLDLLWSAYGSDPIDDDTLDLYQLLDEFF